MIFNATLQAGQVWLAITACHCQHNIRLLLSKGSLDDVFY